MRPTIKTVMMMYITMYIGLQVGEDGVRAAKVAERAVHLLLREHAARGRGVEGRAEGFRHVVIEFFRCITESRPELVLQRQGARGGLVERLRSPYL